MNLLKTYGLPAIAVILVGFSFATANPVLVLFARLLGALMVCAALTAHSIRLGIGSASLLGVFCNGYLLMDKVMPSDAPPFCSINEIIDCRAVNSSEYSEIAGIPVTLLGVAFYLALLLIAAAGEARTPRLPQAAALFMLPALAFSFYLGNATQQLGIICPLCFAIYGVNILIFIGALSGMRESGTQLFGDIGTLLTAPSFAGIVALFAPVVLGGMIAFGGEAAPEVAIKDVKVADQGAIVAKLYMTPGGPINLDGLEPIYGNPNAKYQIVEFADFGCGHCAHAYPELHKLVSDNPDVNLRFKNYPLSGHCNPAMEPREGGEGVCVAALAAECAHQQDKFWPYIEKIFINQRELRMSPDEFEFLAQLEGLDVPKWKSCMEDPKSIEPVLADALAGTDVELRGTPAFFLKGTHGDDWVAITHSPADLARLIEAHRDGVRLPPPRAFQDAH